MAVRLRFFGVTNLFGQYDNEIPLRQNERITAIIGPNGRGKTVCLRLIHALYTKQFAFFQKVDFGEARFDFDNGLSLVVRKLSATEEEDDDPKSGRNLPLRFVLTDQSGHNIADWQPRNRLRRNAANTITHLLAPYITRIGATEWTEDSTGERLSMSDIAERYGQLLPPSIFDDEDTGEPPAFTALLKDVDCHLIETQRLLIIGSADPRYEPHGRRSGESKLVVEQKAQKLRSILQKQLAEYATLSQRLDRSFPRRVIAGSYTGTLTQEEISERLNDLEKKRKALTKAGILDAEFEALNIPEKFDARVAQVLEVYTGDTAEKLNVFSDILSRIDLFREIISDRFVGKDIEIDRTNGFSIRSNTTGKVIPLDKLSSGEQHQLVLLFELLFELKENSLILIDEPELSLHVRWQKRFISDLMRIIDLNHFDVILATHSPQLIGRWRELAVELGSVVRN